MSRFESKKHRASTKDKFVSILKGGTLQTKGEAWYRKKHMFLPLLMIVVFSFLAMALSVVSTIHEKLKSKAAEETPGVEMDYETAKEILNSSGKENLDESD